MRGLRTKLSELRCALMSASVNYDIIILVETWLNASIADAELGMENFKIFRADRSFDACGYSRGGGVLIAVRDSFICKKLALAAQNVEHLYVDIHIGHKHLFVGAIYISPCADTFVYESHCCVMEEQMSESSDVDFLIAGDFNLPHLFFYNDNDGALCCNTTRACGPTNQANVFLCYLNELSLHQYNFVNNEYGNTLDLIFSNLSGINVERAPDDLIVCDKYHPALYFALPVSPRPLIKKSIVTKKNFKRANYAAINDYLSGILWDVELKDKSVDCAVDFLYMHLNCAIANFVPDRTAYRSSFPGWFSGELIALVRAKKKAHCNYKKSGSLSDYLEFSNARSKCRALSRGT